MTIHSNDETAPQGHTSGEWTATIRTSQVGEHQLTMADIQADGPFRGSIAYMQSCEHIGGITGAELVANAHMIAAAPQLYEALFDAAITLEQVCEGQHEDNVCCHHLRNARAAIAKAEGRS